MTEKELSNRLGKFQRNIGVLAESTGDCLTASQVFEELDVFFPEYVTHVQVGDRFRIHGGDEAVVVEDCPTIKGFLYVVLGEADVEFMKYSHFRKLVNDA